MLPRVPLASNVGIRSVSDPLALRAFAHPVRQDLYGLVAREGALTAADAARQLGISHALASHHLRQLAKYGFVEPADPDDRRARPWRVVSTSMRFEPTEDGGRESSAAADRYVAERAVQQLAEWQQRAGDGPAWSAAGVQSGILYLRPDELQELVAGLHALVGPLVDARPIGHPARRPDDALPVAFTFFTVPLPPTEQGG